MQHYRAHPTRPVAVLLSAFLAALTLLLPAGAQPASASRPSSTGAAVAAITQASATADAQRRAAAARHVLAPVDAVPYPFPPFPGPGTAGAAPHRAVGGPAVAVTTDSVEAGRCIPAYRPRGPPYRWSTEVRIDA
ncbi:hypothetical protein GCM10010329_63230 [Streptomyces spiroverticillatus]|nr:hypothetical protein GCM10010329_63230 [Streptomyces spiroverticillatus]